jgi:hypothetical protein
MLAKLGDCASDRADAQVESLAARGCAIGTRSVAPLPTAVKRLSAAISIGDGYVIASFGAACAALHSCRHDGGGARTRHHFRSKTPRASRLLNNLGAPHFGRWHARIVVEGDGSLHEARHTFRRTEAENCDGLSR